MYSYKKNKTIIVSTDLLASSFRTFASNSLLGGYFGKLEGSQASGFIIKNCNTNIEFGYIRKIETRGAKKGRK